MLSFKQFIILEQELLENRIETLKTKVFKDGFNTSHDTQAQHTDTSDKETLMQGYKSELDVRNNINMLTPRCALFGNHAVVQFENGVWGVIDRDGKLQWSNNESKINC